MIKLDDNLMTELGLATLPKEEKSAFLKHMYETLEMRVGTRLAERMSEQQMAEFEQFIASNDEQGAFHWLEGNFPNYKEVVAEEFEKLKTEIKPMASQIVAASQAQAQQLAAGQQFQQPGTMASQPQAPAPQYQQPPQASQPPQQPQSPPSQPPQTPGYPPLQQ